MEPINVRTDYIKVKEARYARFPNQYGFRSNFNTSIYNSIIAYENEGNLEIGFSTFKRYITLIYGIDHILFFKLNDQKYDKNGIHNIIRETILKDYSSFKQFSEVVNFPYSKMLKSLTVSMVGRENNSHLQQYLDLVNILKLGELEIYIGDLEFSNDESLYGKGFSIYGGERNRAKTSSFRCSKDLF